jgi:non-canonical purine NTP pyrophosphatase (RdgB/HAM1 family)
MFKLLFGSNNKGKHDELVDAFAEVGIELVFHGKLDLIEDSPTLELNAISKAQSAANQMKMWTLAEDTGFFIPALDYFPGVHANRWMEGTWKDKRDAIIKMMEGRADRRAYLLNKFALADPQGNIHYLGEVKNWYTIGYEDHINPDYPTFGYNPMLILQGYYVGALTKEQRNFLKNRGRLAPEIYNILKEQGSDEEKAQLHSEKLLKEYNEAYKKLTT